MTPIRETVPGRRFARALGALVISLTAPALGARCSGDSLQVNDVGTGGQGVGGEGTGGQVMGGQGSGGISWASGGTGGADAASTGGSGGAPGFFCTDLMNCTTSTEYCFADAGGRGGAGAPPPVPAYSCYAFPAACGAKPSCDCLCQETCPAGAYHCECSSVQGQSTVLCSRA